MSALAPCQSQRTGTLTKPRARYPSGRSGPRAMAFSAAATARSWPESTAGNESDASATQNVARANAAQAGA